MPQGVVDVVIGRSGGACEAMIKPVCTGYAQHLHHRKISGREHTVPNVLHVCAACHQQYIHMNPAESYVKGWLVKMNHEPVEIPVSYRGQLVTLGVDGSVTPFFKPRHSAGLSTFEELF